MEYTIQYDDVSVSTITKTKTLTPREYKTANIDEFNAMCVTIDTALKGRDGLIKVVRPIIIDGVLVGISYKYTQRGDKN